MGGTKVGETRVRDPLGNWRGLVARSNVKDDITWTGECAHWSVKDTDRRG